MPALISIVKNAHWIDLSDKHKMLREYLENSVKEGCVSGNPGKVIMIKGAFGMGKTNTLHYLFHYGWCKLNVPVLYVSLEKLYPLIEEYAYTLPNKKIGNVEFSNFLNDKVNYALKCLKEGICSRELELFFFGCKPNNLDDFCNEFKPLQLQIRVNGSFEVEEFEKLNSEIINKSLSNSSRPMLLIDEFETKFLLTNV